MATLNSLFEQFLRERRYLKNVSEDDHLVAPLAGSARSPGSPDRSRLARETRDSVAGRVPTVPVFRQITGEHSRQLFPESLLFAELPRVEDDGHYLLKCPPHAISNGDVLEVSHVKTLFTTSREAADYTTDADLWWERVFVPSVDNRPEKYTNVKGGLRSETDGTPLYAFLPADSAGLTYLSVIPVLTFDDRDPMELES